MARTPNYGFEKRRREMERKAKKDAKQARKKDKPEGEESTDGTGEATDEQVTPHEAEG